MQGPIKLFKPLVNALLSLTTYRAHIATVFRVLFAGEGEEQSSSATQKTMLGSND